MRIRMGGRWRAGEIEAKVAASWPAHVALAMEEILKLADTAF